jgi:hypothetical protein
VILMAVITLRSSRREEEIEGEVKKKNKEK